MSNDLEYDNLGRLKYNESLHFNHGKRFTEDDLMYLCKFWEVEGTKSLSLGLGRTEMTLSSKITRLKQDGMYEGYKDKYDELVEGF